MMGKWVVVYTYISGEVYVLGFFDSEKEAREALKEDLNEKSNDRDDKYSYEVVELK